MCQFWFLEERTDLDLQVEKGVNPVVFTLSTTTWLKMAFAEDSLGTPSKRASNTNRRVYCGCSIMSIKIYKERRQ